jgi:hypothetical protein
MPVTAHILCRAPAFGSGTSAWVYGHIVCLALQVSCSDVMDSVGGESTGVPLLLVDVRGEEEMAVSAIPGALHLPAAEDKTQPHGWWVGAGCVGHCSMSTASLARIQGQGCCRRARRLNPHLTLGLVVIIMAATVTLHLQGHHES